MSNLAFIIAAAVVGVVAGGIVNAFVLRTKDGLRFGSRRTCLVCLEPTAMLDAVPLVSYIRLRGKCRRCSNALPWQYPLVEVVLAALFALFAWQALTGVGATFEFNHGAQGTGLMILYFVRNAAVTLFLVPIFLFDLHRFVIPDRLSVPAMILALTFNVALGVNPFWILFGGVCVSGFFSVQYLASRATWIGGGDIRLGLVIGLLLGPWLGLVAVFFAYVLGAAFGVFLLVRTDKTLATAVPFGAFLVVTTLASLFIGSPVLAWYVGLLG